MTDCTDNIRAWAAGTPTREVALELLLAGPKPGMLNSARPWIKDDSWIDGEALYGHTGAWSTSEQTYADIAVSLLGGHDVNLGEVLYRLSRRDATAVLAALSHATGVLVQGEGPKVA